MHDDAREYVEGGPLEDQASRKEYARGREAGTSAEVLYDRMAREEFFRRNEGVLTLELFGDDFVTIFEGEPDGTDDDRAFAAVFSSEQPDLDRLLSDVYWDPHNFCLPDPDKGEEPATIVVVDPSPGPPLTKRYQKIAAVTVADARFATREVEARWREARRNVSAGGAGLESGAPAGSELETREGLTLEPASTVEATRLALSGADRRVLAREDREAVRAYDSLGTLDRLRSIFTTGRLPQPPMVGVSPSYNRLMPAEAEEILYSVQPGIIVCGNNKGGCGKTSTAYNLAAALSKVAHPASREWTEPLKVLLIEANYGNPDLALRMRLPSGQVRGFADFLDDREAYLSRLEDLDARGLAHDPDGGDLLEPDVADYATPHSDAAFDVLLVSGTEYDRSLEGRVTYEDLEALYDSAARHYDLIVVDLDKGTPGEENMRAEVSRFWLEEADVVYLICDRSPNSFEQAAHFREDTDKYFKEIGRPEEIPSMVLLANKWKEPGENDPAGDGAGVLSDPWVRAVEAVGADPPIGAEGEIMPFLRIPDDDTVDDFNRERRAIALESPGWRDALEKLAADALQRITQRCRRQRLTRERGEA